MDRTECELLARKGKNFTNNIRSNNKCLIFCRIFEATNYDVTARRRKLSKIRMIVF
jgi:hypothetical protein